MSVLALCHGRSETAADEGSREGTGRSKHLVSEGRSAHKGAGALRVTVPSVTSLTFGDAADGLAGKAQAATER